MKLTSAMACFALSFLKSSGIFHVIQKNPLVPVMMNHYDSSTSQSPQHTDIPFHEISSSSVVSVRVAKVYFRLVEEVDEFFDVKPTGCHIADMSVWNQHNNDQDNRLYLTQKLQFDGIQTNDSVPHVGIYFVARRW
jgi:hypothetical protein